MSTNKMTALVAAKGSSERVARKNIRPFFNTNLLELKLRHLKEVDNLDRIVVSSEDEEVLRIAINMNVDVHIRDPKYSTSYVPMSEVYTYLASEMESEHIAWVPVTNPLAGPEVYTKAIDTYNLMDTAHDCLLSVYEVKDYIFYNRKPVNFRPNPWPKSQDLDGLCALSFVVNILKRDDMIRWGSLVGNNPFFFYLDPVLSRDIDFQEDFDFCEMIYGRKVKNK